MQLNKGYQKLIKAVHKICKWIYIFIEISFQYTELQNSKQGSGLYLCNRDVKYPVK